MKKAVLLFFVALCLLSASLVFSDSNNFDHVFETSIVANSSHLEHYFVRGHYQDSAMGLLNNQDSSDVLRIEQLNGKAYMPLTVWLQMLENYDIHNKWQVIYDRQHVKIQLVYHKGISKNGGWQSLEEVLGKVTLTVGQDKALKDGKSMTLSGPTIKYKGRVYITVDAIKTLFGYEIYAKDDLLLISTSQLDIENSQWHKVLEHLSTRPKWRIESDVYFQSFKQFETLSVFQYGKNQMGYKMVNQPIREIKFPKNAIVKNDLSMVDETRFYYLIKVRNEKHLYAYDFKLGKHLFIENLTKIAHSEDKTYMDLEISTFTSFKTADGNAYLFTVDNGAKTYRLSNHQLQAVANGEGVFHMMPINGGATFIEYNANRYLPNVFSYTSYHNAVKWSLETPDLTFQELFFVNNKCYASAWTYPIKADDDLKLYEINLNSRDLKNVVPAYSKVWFADKIYFIDSKTRYLKSVDFNGEKEKVLINTPIENAEVINGQCYYTLKDATQGLFKMDLKSLSAYKVLSIKPQTIMVNNHLVGGVSDGAEPGFYVSQNGKTKRVIAGRFNDIKLVGPTLLYLAENNPTIKTHTILP